MYKCPQKNTQIHLINSTQREDVNHLKNYNRTKNKTRAHTNSKRSHICMLSINLRFVCDPTYADKFKIQYYTDGKQTWLEKKLSVKTRE